MNSDVRYATTSDGQLHAYNPALEKWTGAGPGRSSVSEWTVTNASDSSLLGDARCGPSFGFVQSENTGAVIGTVYWMGATKVFVENVYADFVEPPEKRHTAAWRKEFLDTAAYAAAAQGA